MQTTAVLYPWAILTSVALAALLAAEYVSSRRLIYTFKPLASTGFVGAAAAAGAAQSGYGRMMLAALALSWLGDLFLMFKRRSLFLSGLVSFLLAHVAFGVAFINYGQNPTWTVAALAILAAPAAGVARWLHPHLRLEMRKPVWAYITAITAMLALALGTQGAGGHPVVLFGALAFYVSDISVARDRFVASGFINRLWGLPLYYFAQFLLASSVMV